MEIILEYDGRPFLSQEYTYAFMINIDWFQPHKHLTYFVGAIYLFSTSQEVIGTSLRIYVLLE